MNCINNRKVATSIKSSNSSFQVIMIEFMQRKHLTQLYRKEEELRIVNKFSFLYYTISYKSTHELHFALNYVNFQEKTINHIVFISKEEKKMKKKKVFLAGFNNSSE